MAHHSSEQSDALRALLLGQNEAMKRDLLGEDVRKQQELYDAIMPNLGATGRFPEGKLTPEDEGEIQIAIGHKDGKVVVDFGKPTVWIGFTPAQARDIADLLMLRADTCEDAAR
jgi:hypothetical protein